MKPFDLEAAKAGAPLLTRDGRKVTEFKHFETVVNVGDRCAVVLDGRLISCYENGSRWVDRGSELDLFMDEPEKKIWVNEYKRLSDGVTYYGGVYPNAALAAEVIQRITPDLSFIKTHEITL